MGADIAKAALAAGHNVVATGRDIETVKKVLGPADDLLIVKLDVTKPDEAQMAVQSAVDRFGTLDVLVNNAANFYAGFFEEFTPEQILAQLDTNYIGPLNVTRAVLPHMRQQGFGHIISISSTAGIFGYEQCSLYSASKFALEGWMDALRLEVAPFGIKTTVVNPGFFRTTLLEPASTIWGWPRWGNRSAKSASSYSVPKVSRSCIYRLPWGKAAWAMCRVWEGTGAMDWN